MLKNMGNACRIHRKGSERHKKHVFIVVRREMEMTGTGLFVAILFYIEIKRIDPVTAKLLKSRMGCVIDHCSHSNYPVVKQLENDRVTRSISYPVSVPQR
jgi:hypothetical protein